MTTTRKLTALAIGASALVMGCSSPEGVEADPGPAAAFHASTYDSCEPLVAEWNRVDVEVVDQPERGAYLLALGRRMGALGCTR